MDKKRVYSLFSIFGFYLALVIFFTSEAFFFYLVKGGSPDLFNDFKWNMIRWYPWAFFTPFIFRLFRRFPFEKNKLMLTIPVHLIASIFFSFLQTVIFLGYKSITYSDANFTSEMFNKVASFTLRP